ncbi:hypothetical protein AGDE_13699 [Angomonas deanei]|uniref:Uncharacterized protein n=1 Tax=Angomonas deanei TaxID=59799 RepID=A0A7G2C1S6_9TRYP|nr:hypothetical protein AGDE_13699 [Angomonas deanei]CAD2213264.1 hypothetical protein, conserved [Angomonas deanei]|eukprot:EPY21858.1 hypothetical protein AGDE_13699 [Angomonas deanei]
MANVTNTTNTTDPGRLRYVSPDESFWSMAVREFALPALVFAFMLYFIVGKTLVPMYQVGFPTRKGKLDKKVKALLEEEEQKEK